MDNPDIPKLRKPLRLTNYDYSSPGAYFVTICTHNRDCSLGQIVGNTFHPYPAGQIVIEEIEQTALLRAGILIDIYAVMPNHVHAIIIIKAAGQGAQNNLSNIIKMLKAQITRRIRQAGLADFAWQKGFYEYVIRGEHDLKNAREYVVNNPARWAEDKNNPNK